ncbi:hypothetical protein CRG98_033451 [Punica granatum]|uniref:TIR domain-containing protein n=1 Tax=Punica granatum TaxID=22663 RepID=A0A2I0IR55_PUNGR|nr:hypothetical protein CRG98_033451 [Punica granatum]
MAPKRKRTPGTTYEVFLSFRGPDTRQGFTDVLYHALIGAGIHVFRDDEEIRRGEDIGEEILTAIEESRIFVPIFSKTYASSKWCLVELAKMVESKEKSSGKVEQWKKALRKAGKIKGWELKNTGHGEFVRSFAREVFMKLKVKHKCVAEYLVQRDYQVEDVMKLLDIESSEVRFVGIHGMGGIGKTTLAKLVFNELLGRFDGCSFLADVRESSRQHKGIELLQKQLLGDLGLPSGEIGDVDDGIITMRKRLPNKKVLIVLDDVDHKDQIQNLAGDASWFGSGSRILITTRDQRVVIGSLLRDKRRKEWKDTIERLQRVPHRDVQKTLKISYDALEDETKNIFLDIACFFINRDKRYPSYMWEACDFDPKMGLKVLVHMSMVKIINKDGMKRLWMHDQLRDLGRTIVTDKSFKNIVKRSRLWKHEDALEVLQQDEDKRKIEMLRVRSYDNSYGYFEDAGYEYIFTQKELSSLRNLRYLECSGANFSGHLEHRLQKLMWLSWRRCPEKFMGTDLCLRKLVILDLSCSSISETWDGWSQIGTRNSLKVLDLHYCDCLTKMPDLSKYSTLERLILRQCTNLVEIDTSIGTLRGLKELDLEFCSSLEGLPEELFCPELIGNLQILAVV